MIYLGALRLPIAACIEFLAIQNDLEAEWQKLPTSKCTEETVDDNHTNWSGPDVFQQLQQMRSSKAEISTALWKRLKTILPDLWYIMIL